MVKFQGILPPIATPFDYSGEIYKAKVRHNVEKWNQVKLGGYVVCGSTGESVLLTTDEKTALWGMVADYAAADRLLVAGTGMESVRETVALTNIAAGLGYTAAMVRTPHYYKNLLDSVEAQVLFFSAVADQVKIPVMVYNWPQTTGIDIAPEAVARLSAHPNVIAIKESSGNVDRMKRMMSEASAGFQVLDGSAPKLWEALQAGSPGAVLAFANAAPYACVTIWEAHRTREQEAGEFWQNKIANPANLVTVKYGIPGLKYAMDLNGFYGGPCRLPLRPLAPEAKYEIEQAFADLRG
ncbi:MAG: dihydrodipicolinate synthase family protein [Bryobacteraceae bacterium]